MKIRYNRVVGIVMLVLGAVCTFLGLWLLALGEPSPAVVVGLIPLLLGILYLVRPYFWVHGSTVAVTAVIGSMSRDYPFERLETDGGKLIAVSADGTRKRVPVARWLAHSGDWRTIVAGAGHRA